MSMIADLIRAEECINDPVYFDRFFFKQRYGAKMIVSPHIKLMGEVRERVFDGEIKRLIINMPPRYMKTEFWTIDAIAKGLAINPRARFMGLSYSQKLALKNSSDARSIVRSKSFQSMWPMQIKNDSDSKEIWHNEFGGGVVAGPSGGQVTGFGAGLMEPGFTGFLGIDDPVKPGDAYSEVIRGGVNDGYNETIASRIAHEDVPIIIPMQRIHYDDLSGYLLRGGSGEKWHHLNLPVYIDHSKPYPTQYTHGIPIEHDLPYGWLWPEKHNEKHRKALMAHKRRWFSQYMQDPKRYEEEGALWTEKLIANAISKPKFGRHIRTVIGVDPAVSDDEGNDDTGIVAASAYDNETFSVDADYTLNSTTQTWVNKVIWAYNRHHADAVVVETNQGGALTKLALRNAGFYGRIIEVHASKGKYARAEPISALYEQDRVRHESGLADLEDEYLTYVPYAVKRSPNRLDAAVWALFELSKGQVVAGV